jgi:hypothetical protein
MFGGIPHLHNVRVLFDVLLISQVARAAIHSSVAIPHASKRRRRTKGKRRRKREGRGKATIKEKKKRKQNHFPAYCPFARAVIHSFQRVEGGKVG